MSYLRALLALAMAALLGAGGPGAAAASTDARAAGSRGSMSGGDRYFPLDGNGGYDVRHYRIKVTYRPGSDRLRGRTVVEAKARKELTSFHLDLALTPDKVLVDGRAARFSKPRNHELRVKPRRPVVAGARFEVLVRYHGRPGATRAAGLSPFFHRRGEGLALGEPQIGPWWFAANETPADKATYDIALRVPRGRQAVSNGELVSRRATRGWRTWRWEMTDPMTTYLAFFTVGRFDLQRGSVDGRPYVYAVSDRLGPVGKRQSMSLMRRTPGIVSWLEAQFGAYPFESVGGVVTGLPVGFALETQSRPVYPYVGGPAWHPNVLLVVHEQAHQWFGDDVAVRRWRDIWLNEGFATYAEWLYDEAHGGRSVDDALLAAYSRGAGSSFWSVRVGDPGPDQMFGWPVYDRGAMTLAALRNRIGHTAMRDLLREWVARNREAHGTGGEFRALAEELSGQELDAFFAEWLDQTDKPDRTAANGLP